MRLHAPHGPFRVWVQPAGLAGVVTMSVPLPLRCLAPMLALVPMPSMMWVLEPTLAPAPIVGLVSARAPGLAEKLAFARKWDPPPARPPTAEAAYKQAAV